MAVPKRRQSKSRSKKRNSHKGLKPAQLQRCTQCGTAVPSHVICPNCGSYHGRSFVEIEE
ncbi:MAG: 50S ribosomal protein L32 [Planctomycetaceae bacterium]|nr:50S ribosomal protein L32 [Planctomycetaceae bacterium]